MLGRSLSYWFSREFLSSRFMLWSLFWINLLGTVYGYIWYGNQLVYTAVEMSPLYLPFVPDSPTASLFFTWAVAYWLLDHYRSKAGSLNPTKKSGWRSFVEAFAVVTSFKYGIWAVAMIFAGAYKGDTLVWQDWMLVFSHLGMAAEAVLYFRLYRYRWLSVILVACWVLLNDTMDYGQGVYPWLPKVLEDNLSEIATFTLTLSVFSVAIALVLWLVRELRPARTSSK